MVGNWYVFVFVLGEYSYTYSCRQSSRQRNKDGVGRKS